MKTVQKFILFIAACVLLVGAGCKNTDETISCVFLSEPIFSGRICRLRVSCKVLAQDNPVAKVIADLSGLGGSAEQVLTLAGNNIWQWCGQVTPGENGLKTVKISAFDEIGLQHTVQKTVQVYKPGKVIAIAVSNGGYGDIAMALKSDGTVVTWNLYSAWYNLTGSINDAIAITADDFYCYALKSDGTVVAWYADSDPYFYKGPNDIIAITAGENHLLALKSDGSVVTWHRDDFERTFAVHGLTDVVAIDAFVDNFAVKADGTVASWYASYEGDGTIQEKLFDVISAIAFPTSLYLKSDGSVFQMRGGSFLDLPVRAGAFKAKAIDQGSDGTCLALLEDGSVKIWTNEGLFSYVAQRFKNIIAIAAGNKNGIHLALKEDGTVFAWQEKWLTGIYVLLAVPEELQ